MDKIELAGRHVRVTDEMVERALVAYAQHAERLGFDKQTPEMASYRRVWLRKALESALRESEELRRDAERYHFLRDSYGRFIDRGARIEAGISTPGWLGKWASFDAAIDSARGVIDAARKEGV